MNSYNFGCQNENTKVEVGLLTLGRCFRFLFASGILGVSGGNIV